MRVERGSTYIMRGGPEGRERLRLVTRVMAPATTALLDRVGVADDANCLDVGCEPPHRSFARYIELYVLAARSRGVDPDIGPRLPAILAGAGCSPVHVNVAQPVGRRPDGYEGDVKLTAPITLETIAATILTLGLAEQEELDATVDDLYRLAADDETLIGAPRMVQAWGYRPG